MTPKEHRLPRLALSVLVWILAGSAVSAQVEGAVQAVNVDIEVEGALLDEDLRRYDQLAGQRREAMNRLTSLYQSLDAAVQSADPSAPGRLGLLMEQIQRVEGERAALLASARLLVERIDGRLRRVVLLERQLESLKGRRVEQQAGTLSGTWSLVLLPNEQRGRCTLEQTGAVINGTYQLEGGWTGSLQGTLVKRKVFLMRIDSRLGKMMEFEGFLSADGQQIRGSWLNYELAGQQGAAGQWSARRVSEAPTGP